MKAILITLLSGLSFLLGYLITKFVKNEKRLVIFAVGFSFTVILGLILFDLLPEIYETKNIYLVIPVLCGLLLLVFLDKLIPHHHHEHHDDHDDIIEHNNHLNHISVVTIIALAIHNMIEGLSLYNVSLTNIKSGILMMIGISLHNIPLGFQIGNSLNSKKYSKLLIFLLCISSFIGALIMILFGSPSEMVISILLSITLGMLLYILIFELFNEVRINIKKKETIYGIIIGIIILIITNIL
jgi:ZIP family zinc transporter